MKTVPVTNLCGWAWHIFDSWTFSCASWNRVECLKLGLHQCQHDRTFHSNFCHVCRFLYEL